MNDEQPIVPTPDPVPTTPEPRDVSYPATTKLDGLPEHMKTLLNGLIKIGYGSQKIKAEFERKFDRYEDIVPASRGTYEAYIHNHYDQLMQEVAVQNATIDAVAGGMERAVDFADAVTGGDAASKREQIENLKAFMIGRIEFLRNSQSAGIPNSQIENNIATYVNGVRSLIEKSIEYGQELNKEDENQIEVYMEGLIEEFLENLVEIYKNLHGDNKLKEFEIALGTKLSEILKNALQEKNRDEGNNQ